MKALALTALFLVSGGATAAPELKYEKVEVSFELPDGSIHSTILLDEEVRLLIGEDGAYQTDWWIRGAEMKLEVPKLLARIPGGLKAKSAASVVAPSPLADSIGTLGPPLERELPRVSVGYERISQQ
jgi:hypothetical protein